MAKFKFRLAVLQQIRESTRDDRHTELAQALEADEIVAREQQRIETELSEFTGNNRNASGPGTVNVNQLLDYRRYELVLHSQQQHIGQQRKRVQDEIQRRRAALVEADREVKILEKLREKQLERHRDEENQRDIKLLDEVAGRPRLTEQAL